MKKLILILLVLRSFNVNAQVDNDYRTKGSGNWNDPTVWERYDGSNWVGVTSSPNSISAGRTFTIRNGHMIVQNREVSATNSSLIIEQGGSLKIKNYFSFRGASVFNYGTVHQDSMLISSGVNIHNYEKWIMGVRSAVLSTTNQYNFNNYDSLLFYAGSDFINYGGAFSWIFNSGYIRIQSRYNIARIGVCLVENKQSGFIEVDSVQSFRIDNILNLGKVIIKNSTGNNHLTITNNGQFDLDNANISSGYFDNYGVLTMRDVTTNLERFIHEGEIAFQGSNRFVFDYFKSVKSISFPIGTKVSCRRNDCTQLLTFMFNDSAWFSGRGKGIVQATGVLTGMMSDTTIIYGKVVNQGGFSTYTENHGQMICEWNWGWNLAPAEYTACNQRFLNLGQIVVNRFGSLYDGVNSYGFSCRMNNDGLVVGQGVIRNFCSPIKGGFEPRGRISIQTDSLVECLSLKVGFYEENGVIRNDTLESFGAIKLGKKLVASELAIVPNGKYLIITSKSNIVVGVFETLNLPFGYSLEYEESKVYLVKNISSVVYTFTGSGNYSSLANWNENKVPPNPLPPGSTIVIAGSGECILDIPLTISSGAILRVEPGKIFRVNGNLIRQ